MHIGLAHVGAQGAGVHGLSTVGQAQNVVHLGLGTGDDHTLELAGGRLSLDQVGGRDHRQAEVAGAIAGRTVMGTDVGHVSVGQGTDEGERKDGIAGGGAALSGHGDCASAKQSIQPGLQVGAQHRRIGRVGDGRTESANTILLNRYLKAACRQFGLDRQRADDHFVQVISSQSSAKAQPVGICAIGCDTERAQVTQSLAVCCGGA